MPDTPNIQTSGGIITSSFIDAARQPSLNHPMMKPETFATRGSGDRGTAFDRLVAETWELLLEDWERVRGRLHDLDVSMTRRRWLLPLLQWLDFEPQFLNAAIQVGELRFAVSHRGWPGDAAPVVHLVEPGQDLDEKATRGGKSPHDLVQTYLNATPDQRWGMVSNGVLLRVLRDYHHTYTRGFVEFDLEAIFETKDFADFRALFRLVHASRFVPNDEGICPLEQFYKDSVATGVQVGKKLRPAVVSAIEILGNGFLSGPLLTNLQSDETKCREFFSEILHVVYRILFLLFAEQQGMMPGRNSLYAEEYSITRLRERAEQHARSVDHHRDLWEGLKVTFDMLHRGVPDLHVFGYNGMLFDEAYTPTLNTLTCRNAELLAAVRYLSLMETGGILQRISYADLGVEELGSVYESLLDYTPRVTTDAEVVEDREIPANRFFLDPRGSARKTSGSYYTHPSLVNQLIESALIPVLEDRLSEATAEQSWSAVGGGRPDEKPGTPLVMRRWAEASREARERAEEALLSITVCDPACGSGAFLIAATNALGLELARIRSGTEYPDDPVLREAKREVLQHCIYGVDVNPMAVELCKVSLWINACVTDKPLNFLDHHIKCGNSLIGTMPDTDITTVPDDAFKAVTGDETTVATTIRARNKKEREKESKQGLLPLFGDDDSEAIAPPDIDDMPENTPADVEAKRRKYQAWQSSQAWLEKRTAADLWTAAFFVELTDANDPRIPTTARLRQYLDSPKASDGRMVAQARALAAEHRFFHWGLEFPEVFGRDGFDVVLGNPPWEQFKVNEREWFAGLVPEIADEGSAPVRSRRIAALEQRRPDLHRAWLRAHGLAELHGAFARSGGRFPLTACGDLNTYPLFAEHACDATNALGRAGLVVKTGLLVNETWSGFIRTLLAAGQMASAYDFVNSESLFPGLAPPERFALVTIVATSAPDAPMRLAFLHTNTDQLIEPEGTYALSSGEVLAVNPNTGTLPQFSNSRDALLTARMYQAAPVLHRHSPDTNDWGLRYYRMFDMKNDAGCFADNTLEPLLEAGWELGQDAKFRKGSERMLPLHEAKLFECYDHRNNTFEGISRTRRFVRKAVPATVDTDRKQESGYEVLPRYWLSESDFCQKTDALTWGHEWVFAMRDVTQSITNRKVAVGTIVPWLPLSNKCPAILFEGESAAERAVLFQAIFASLPFDYVVRQKLAGASLNLFILEQIAAPPPYAFERVFRLNGEDYSAASLALGWALELVCVTDSLMPLGRELGLDQPFPWDSERRFWLRRSLDAIAAHLYGMSRDDLAYALQAFRIINDQDERQHGYHRTADACLQQFDAIANDKIRDDLLLHVVER